MYDLNSFSLSDMIRCNAELRKIGQNAGSMEEVAQNIVRYFFHNLTDKQAGDHPCVLVRFYSTLTYGDLTRPLQQIAQQRVTSSASLSSNLRCLTLIASAGIEPAWNDRRKSQDHQVIPLTDPAMVASAPMVSRLIHAFGLDVAHVLQPKLSPLSPQAEPPPFNVFFIPQAHGSTAVPAQDSFVVPYHIQSVLGFGGMLHTGTIFAVILFTRVLIPPEVAEMFRTMALAVKLSLLPFAGAVFSADGAL